MLEKVKFFLLPFGFIRVTYRIEGLIFEGGRRRINYDDGVEPVIDGIVMGDEGVRKGFRSDEAVRDARVCTDTGELLP